MAKKRTTRLSKASKNANGKQWYKDKAKTFGSQIQENFEAMVANYNMFNNKVDLTYYDHICESSVDEVDGRRRTMPAKIVNKDITSGKIKVLLGMEAKQPFKWKVSAVNSEATTRKETEEFNKIKQFVINSIVAPIKTRLEQEALQQAQGQELSQEQQQQIQQKITEQLKAQTPPEVRKYMQTEHQDPVEIMSHQILEYLIKELDLPSKFNLGFKHLNLGAREVFFVGIFNNDPKCIPVNPKDFTHSLTKDQQFIQDSEWARCRYQLTGSEIIRRWGSQMTTDQLDDIEGNASLMGETSYQEEYMWDWSRQGKNTYEESFKGYDAIHTVWRSLRKVGFLTMRDDSMDIVSEEYKLNPELGDVSIEWRWLPEVYETWQVKDMFFDMQPLPGQFLDIDNPGYHPLPYIGAISDNTNSGPTCTMDRLAEYQHSVNIYDYRIKSLMAQDKGKKLLLDVKAIPDSKKMSLADWTYNFDSTPFAWINLASEGNSYSDINTMSKVIDLSNSSDISQLREMLEQEKRQAGESIGITPGVEGQSGPDQSLGNNQQDLVQSSHILYPLFSLHNTVKRDVLMALLNTAKIAWRGSNKKKLTYVLDDLSEKILEIDMVALNASSFGIFVENSSDATETRQMIISLADRMLSSDKIEPSDVLAVINQKGTAEAEATLKASEEKRQEIKAEEARQQHENAKEIQQMQSAESERAHEREKELIILKEEEKRKTVIAQTALMGASFNPDTDADGDGVNDFVEIAKDGLDADIRRKEHKLDRDKFEHDKATDKEKLKIERNKNSTKK